MKGYELIKKISDGEIEDGTKIKVVSCGIRITELEVKNKGLIWQNGMFTTSQLCNNEYTFEIIKEKPKKIDLLEFDYEHTIFEKADLLKEKINKQTKVLNYLLEKSDSE